METAAVPGIYDSDLGDGSFQADTEAAFRTAIAAGRDLGLAISPSAAANLNAALELAGEIGSGTIATIITDGAAKYLQDRFWINPRLSGRGSLPPAWRVGPNRELRSEYCEKRLNWVAIAIWQG